MVGSKFLALVPLLGVASAAAVRFETRDSNTTSSSSSSNSTSSSDGDSSTIANGYYNTTTPVGPYGLNNANCQNITLQVPVNLTLTNFTNVDDTYSNQSYITKQLIEYTTATSNWTQAHMGSNNETFNLNQTFNIAGYYCEPKQGAKNDSALINFVHGIGFDATYWDFALSDEYSVVKHAASYGYRTFRYDRLGTGNSETPSSGFEIPRVQTEVAILKNILGRLRNTTEVGNRNHNRIVGVGHSYGSVQNQAITVEQPELLDAVVLTGFSTNSTNMKNYLQAAAYSIAKDIFPDRFAQKPATWLVTGSNASDITGFFYPPYYSEDAFSLSRATEQPVTLGALVTVGSVGGMANNFTGPVHVVNGAKDFIFCSSNCYAGANGSTVPEEVKMLYPQTQNFTTYIAENTGHAITPHYSGPNVAHEIVAWIQDQGL